MKKTAFDKAFMESWKFNLSVKPEWKGDKAIMREQWHVLKDMYHRQGLITDWQVQNWIYPKSFR